MSSDDTIASVSVPHMPDQVDGTIGFSRGTSVAVAGFAPTFDPSRGPAQIHLLNAILDSSTDQVYVIDRDQRIVYVNQADADAVGVPREILIGKTLAQLNSELGLPAEAVARQQAEANHVFTTGETVQGELTYIGADGPRHFAYARRPLFADDGSVAFVLFSSTDITDATRARRHIEDNQERFRLALDAAQLGIWEIDLANLTGRLSDQIGPMLGYPSGYQITTLDDWAKHVHPDDLGAVRTAFSHALENYSVFNVEHRVIWPDGKTIRWMANRGEIVRDERGVPLRAVGVILDITERKRSEEALQEREVLYRMLAESMPHLVWMAHPDGTLEYTNRRWRDYTGTLPGMDAYVTLFTTVHPEDKQAALTHWHKMLRTGMPYETEVRFRRASDGMYRWNLVRALPVRDEKGTILHWLGTNTDIHDQKQREENERFLAGFGAHIRAVFSPEEVLEEAVHATVRYLSVSRCSFNEIDEEQDRFTILRAYHEGSMPISGTHRLSAYAAAYNAELREGKTVVIHNTRTDPRTANHFEERYATTRNFAMVIVPLLKKGKWVSSFSVSSAAGPRRWLEHEVALIEQIAERTSLAVDNVRLESERRAADYAAGEEIRRLNADLQERIFRFETLFNKLPVGIVVAEDPRCEVVKANPAFTRWVDASPVSNLSYNQSDRMRLGYKLCRNGVELPTEELPLRLAIREGRDTGEYEIELVREDGSRMPLLAYASPLFDAAGNIRGSLCTLVDLTEIKRAQEERAQYIAEIEGLNIRLRRAMSETHHRVKNNLQVISALINLQALNHTDAVPIGELDRLTHHIKSLATLHELLTYQAKGDGEVTHISVRLALDKLMPGLQLMAAERSVTQEVEDTRLPVRQGTTLSMLVNELVANAIKHGTGAIHIAFHASAGKACLSVSDEGPGFPDGFDPVQAAHTGIELIESLARWDLQGETFYRNHPQGGACVLVEFPL